MLLSPQGGALSLRPGLRSMALFRAENLCRCGIPASAYPAKRYATRSAL